MVADDLSRAPVNDPGSSDEYEKLHVYTVFEELSQVKLSNFLNIKDARIAEIVQHTEEDQSLKSVAEYIRQGWPRSIDSVPDSVKIYFNYRQKLTFQDGLLFRTRCVEHSSIDAM